MNDFEDVAGEFVEVVNGENSEGDETPRSLNLSDVAANAHQSVLSKHLKEDNKMNLEIDTANHMQKKWNKR